MFIKESMRLYPPVILIGREIDKDLTVRSKLNKLYETVIPTGTRVLLSIFGLHRNELVWKEPEVSIRFTLLRALCLNRCLVLIRSSIHVNKDLKTMLPHVKK